MSVLYIFDIYFFHVQAVVQADIEGIDTVGFLVFFPGTNSLIKTPCGHKDLYEILCASAVFILNMVHLQRSKEVNFLNFIVSTDVSDATLKRNMKPYV